MDRIVSKLEEYDAIRTGTAGTDHVTHRSVPRQIPESIPLSSIDCIPPILHRALGVRGIPSLYDHQLRAIEAALAGRDVVLEAPTASGKTLSFVVPMLAAVRGGRRRHGLALYPMKALSNDQRRQFQEFADSVVWSGPAVESALYDGDTSVQDRRLIRKSPPEVLLTNPEMIHLSLLGHHDKWQSFLENLAMIVLDEIHEYRGHFGSHVALVLRRLLLRLEKHGASPQLFLCSATCANAVRHAAELTGREFFHVKPSVDLRPQRDFLFVQPSIPDYRYAEIYRLRIARAALAFQALGRSTLVFCPTRVFSEEVAQLAKREAEQFGLPPSEIAIYRAGLDANHRREIEGKIRSGEYKVVFTTNALELGVDIGCLDACILAGFPDNPAAAWQRIGRVGRGWDRDGIVLYLAQNTAYDGFFAQNIDAFLARELDDVRADASNPTIVQRHVPFVLYESDWKLKDRDKDIIGDHLYSAALKQAERARPISRGIASTYSTLDLRGSPGVSLQLMDGGTQIGTISEAQAFREAHIGAVYKHFGRSYRVESIGLRKINLKPEHKHVRTEPVIYTEIQDMGIISATRLSGAVSLYHGDIAVMEHFSTYRELDAQGDVIEEVRTVEASRRLSVRAFWIEFEDLASITSIFEKRRDTAIATLEQLIRVGAIFAIPSDRHDSSTYSNLSKKTIYLYETTEGGTGIADRTYESWQLVLQQGVAIATKCRCTFGCPRCIQPPRRRNSESIEKLFGVALAGSVLQLQDRSEVEVYDPTVMGWVKNS